LALQQANSFAPIYLNPRQKANARRPRRPHFRGNGPGDGVD
jgi:hypothetical protein